MKIQLALACTVVISLLAGCASPRADKPTSADRPIHVNVARNGVGEASAAFKFGTVPSPVKNDAAEKGTFTIVESQRDRNGGEVSVLQDGKVPAEEDAPAESFFFRQGSDGGRLLLDLGTLITVKEVNTYSWHPATRGPQVYHLYGADGTASGFEAKPPRTTEPEKCGWKLLAKVDTRGQLAQMGGQFGVSIGVTNGNLGTWRYLLFDIFQTEANDTFGNTFLSEIDVLDAQGPAPEPVQALAMEARRETVTTSDGKCTITIDTSEMPDLTDWARQEIAPMLQEWYPKMVQMLPSEGFSAPSRFSVTFSKDMQGVTVTGGTRIRCAGRWMRANVKGEAKGAIFHEMVHVVQQYGRAPRATNSVRAPGWLTEGITDYIRWYLFEPQSKGAEITRRNFERARYDGSYRITANFLNFVSEKYDRNFVPKLNAIIREGKYNEAQWKNLTGRSAEELGTEWKAALEKKLGPIIPVSTTNTLSGSSSSTQ